MNTYGEETPLFPHNGNPNPVFVSYPSGLAGQSPLLHNDYDPSAHDYYAPLERRVLPPAPPPPPQADQPQPPPLKKRKTERASPSSSSAAIPSAAPPPAPAPASAPAAPPKKKKNPSSAVTPQELAALRGHYDFSYPTWPRATREAERVRVAALVGVTPRIVIVKYGEFHRQEKAKRAAAQANDADE